MKRELLKDQQQGIYFRIYSRNPNVFFTWDRERHNTHVFTCTAVTCERRRRWCYAAGVTALVLRHEALQEDYLRVNSRHLLKESTPQRGILMYLQKALFTHAWRHHTCG